MGGGAAVDWEGGGEDSGCGEEVGEVIHLLLFSLSFYLLFIWDENETTFCCERVLSSVSSYVEWFSSMLAFNTIFFSTLFSSVFFFFLFPSTYLPPFPQFESARREEGFFCHPTSHISIIATAQ